jgi:hypothetical protein
MAIGEQRAVEGAGTAPAGTRGSGRLEALAPLSGILGVVLIAVGVVIAESGDTPDEDSTPQQILAYFDEEDSSILMGTLVFVVGLLFILWFIGSLRAALAEAEGRPNRLSSLLLAGGTGMVVCLTGAIAPQFSAALSMDEGVELTPDTAQAMWLVGDGLFFFGWFFCGFLLVAAGLLFLRTGFMPKWFGIVSIAMGVLMPVWFIGWAIFFFLFPIWVIALSVILYRRNSAATPAV